MPAEGIGGRRGMLKRGLGLDRPQRFPLVQERASDVSSTVETLHLRMTPIEFQRATTGNISGAKIRNFHPGVG